MDVNTFNDGMLCIDLHWYHGERVWLFGIMEQIEIDRNRMKSAEYIINIDYCVKVQGQSAVVYKQQNSI